MHREVGLDDDRQVGVVAAASTGVDVLTHPAGRYAGELVIDVSVEQLSIAEVGDHVGKVHVL